MKKSALLAAEAVWRAKIASSSWGSQLPPVRPPRSYLTAALSDDLDSSALLLCDPLTGLVAYPSFEAQMISELPQLAPTGLHVAIGDVDDLRGYVNAARDCDPTLFGHLAGNDCMRRVGEAAREWSAEILDCWPFAICATFGGDEVIVAAAGRPYGDFLAALNVLAGRIRSTAPRPCSFASATTMPMERLAETAEETYRDLLSRVDRCLFGHKAASRKIGDLLAGALVDVGAIALLGHPDWLRFELDKADGETTSIS